MKEGLQIGARAEVTAKVSEEMFAQFEGQIVHRAYSTVAMVYHMEWASRKIILPYLESHEEGSDSEAYRAYRGGNECSCHGCRNRHHRSLHCDKCRGP